MDELWYEFTEEGQRVKRRIVILKCAYMLFSIALFLIGWFQGISWLTFLSGCLIVIYDILDMLAGTLNPTFPIIFAIILAIIIKPWYTGIFWASAIWHIFSFPWYIKTLLSFLKSNAVKRWDPLYANKHNEAELERIRKLNEQDNKKD